MLLELRFNLFCQFKAAFGHPCLYIVCSVLRKSVTSPQELLQNMCYF